MLLAEIGWEIILISSCSRWLMWLMMYMNLGVHDLKNDGFDGQAAVFGRDQQLHHIRGWQFALVHLLGDVFIGVAALELELEVLEDPPRNLGEELWLQRKNTFKIT